METAPKFAHWRWGVFPCEAKDTLSGFYCVNGGTAHVLVWLKDQLYRLSEDSSIPERVRKENVMCDSGGDPLTVVKGLLVAEDGAAFLASSGTTVSLCRVAKTYRVQFAWTAQCCCWSGDEVCLATSESLEFRQAKDGTVLRTISLSFFPTCIAPVLAGVATGGNGHLAVVRDATLTEMDLAGYNCLQIQATRGRLLVEAEVEPSSEQTVSIQLPGGQKLSCVEPTSILTLRQKVIVPIATEKMEKGPHLPHGVYHLEDNDVFFAHWENGQLVVSQHVFLPTHRWQNGALQFVQHITEKPDDTYNSPRVVSIRAWKSGVWVVTASQPSEIVPFCFSKSRVVDVHTYRFPAKPHHRTEPAAADLRRAMPSHIPPPFASQSDSAPDRTALQALLLPSAAPLPAGPPLVRVVGDDDNEDIDAHGGWCRVADVPLANQFDEGIARKSRVSAEVGGQGDGNPALLEEVRLLRQELRTLTSSFTSFQQDFSRLVDHFTLTNQASSIN